MANPKTSIAEPAPTPRLRHRPSPAELLALALARLNADLPVNSAQVCCLLDWRRRTLFANVSRGTFPAPISKNGATNIWPAAVVRAHLAALGAHP